MEAELTKHKMMNPKKGRIKPGTKRYASVAEMMAADGTSRRVRREMAKQKRLGKPENAQP